MAKLSERPIDARAGARHEMSLVPGLRKVAHSYQVLGPHPRLCLHKARTCRCCKPFLRVSEWHASARQQARDGRLSHTSLDNMLPHSLTRQPLLLKGA
eukprot:scaffold193233_cov28-Tisochrysis_lutea.AAC.1